ncbi:MAG: hypothetical protein GXP46_10200 [Deferribacteres bacterium]|nr:hypothetical protein [Deferribacteres bacterium]
MRRHGGSFTGIVCFLVCFAYACLAAVSSAGAVAQAAVWEGVSSGIRGSDLLAVAARPDSPETVYITSGSVVYMTADGGKSWKEVLSFRGTGNTVNALAVAKAGGPVYAGTGDGLYRSIDGGENWEKIFAAMDGVQGRVLCITTDPAAPAAGVFIGTGSGLFRTDDGGVRWEKGRGIPSGIKVSSIAVSPSDHRSVYAAADDGLYKSLNSGADWRRMLVTYVSEEDRHTGDMAEETETEGTGIRSIAVGPADSGRVYLGTSEGLLASSNGGLTWERMTRRGLISRDIRGIAVDPSNGSVYAATGSGVFVYSDVEKRWKGLYSGLLSADVRSLSFALSERGAPGILFAATKRGVFKTTPGATGAAARMDNGMYHVDLSSAFAHEPGIGEIREAAIKYAEVQPEKIEKWRRAAAKRAWLPDLRIAYRENSGWQSSDYFYKGNMADDDITEDTDREWTVSLTWELGDLVWNSAQTSIDSRARLMVQLRDDILNEVTRLYFERRRLQYEMLLSPPGDVRERIENELRLQELTADIDALTNSYLSKRLARIQAAGR